jgi:formate dehydrogenase subunit gamma
LARILFLVAFVLVAAPVAGLLDSERAFAQEQKRERQQQREQVREQGEDENVRSNFWRAVREGDQGYSAVSGPGANVLIQNGGQNWRDIRNGPVKFFGTWLMAGTLLVVLVFFLIRGQVKLEKGRSGITVPRWNVFERVIHWCTAVLFLILLITGLSMFFGRELLIPIFGKDGFAAYAQLTKDIHNYAGPFFAVGIVIEILMWIWHNFPNRNDFAWFAQGGGMVGSAHPSSGRMNGGEKLWFWIIVVFGLGSIATGLILDFPNYGQTREQMQIAHIVHVSSAIVLTCFAFGHIYIGTLGSEGSLEAMATGRVDVEWAKQHHDLWYEDLIKSGVKPESAEDATAPREEIRGAEPRTT